MLQSTIPIKSEDSGFDFVGYDWNATFLVEVDMEVCESIEYDDGSVEEFCGGI